jgi:hypothetical protein
MVAPDPIRARRAQIGRLAELGRRIGYGFIALAVVAFVAAIALDVPRWLVIVVVLDLVVGSVLLVPAIILGYGVKKAEREDPLKP